MKGVTSLLCLVAAVSITCCAQETPIFITLPDPASRCETTLCSVGTVCVQTPQGPECRPDPAPTCATTECRKGQTCRIVYENGDTSPKCIETEIPAPSPAGCEVGRPLLIFDSGTPVTAFCGRGFNRIDCPEGWFCNISPTDEFAYCCENVIVTLPDPASRCETTLCSVGTVCVQTPQGPECQSELPDPAPTCATTECRQGQTCRIVYKDGDTSPRCIDKSKISRRTKASWCGHSGHPVLEAQRSGARARYIRTRTCPRNKGFIETKRGNICCADTVKKGDCPAVCGFTGCPRDTGPCSASCKGDNDCPHNRKCCRTFCGGPQCVAPDFPFLACSDAACLADASCKILKCPADERCVDSNDGAQCLPFTPLSCDRVDCLPNTTCIDFPAGPSCLPLGSTCAVVRCGTDTQCVEDPNGASCQPVSPGVCPEPSSSLCVVSCKGDVQCSRGQKCCGTTCGGQVCTDPILEVFTCGGKCIAGIPCAILDCFNPISICVDLPGGRAECRNRIKEGVCPPAFAVERNPRDPNPGCVSDPNCPRNLKCCPSLNDGSVCVDPLPRATCASTDCILPSVCVEPPGGNAECRIPSDKPGVCPSEFSGPVGDAPCNSDADCRGDEKCCTALLGGDALITACADPILAVFVCSGSSCVGGIACAIVDCFDPTTICVETGRNAECRDRIKEGSCPPPFAVERTRVDTICDSDPDCPGDRKCCDRLITGTAPDGRVCVDPLPRPTCASTLCPVGTVCVESRVGTDCKPAPKAGTCPITLCAAPSQCQDQCQLDMHCEGAEKCCQLCGCKVCVPAGPPNQCDLVDCGPGNICIGGSNGPECHKQNPGVCPREICPFQPISLCNDICEEDANCGPSEKCCRGCDGCLQCLFPDGPDGPPTCQGTECKKGERCELQIVPCVRAPCPPVPRCVPIEKPGVCPVAVFPPGVVGICANLCANDNDCDGGDKCCRVTACGGTDCTPVITCANTLCSQGTACIETKQGPRCILQKPGECPIFPCAPPPRDDLLVPSLTPVCEPLCEADVDCPGHQKCCFGCGPCNRCFDPFNLPSPSPCDAVTCERGQECRLQPVVCGRSPCPPVATCEPIGSTIGQCPATNPGDPSICAFTCDGDASCERGEKCCRGCGTSCEQAVPVTSCANVRCGNGQTCQEVTEGGVVTVTCVDQDLCELPKDVGPCEAIIPRFYYNSQAKECQRFDFGGCQGNANNFEDIDSCKKACGEDPCKLPKDVGLCRAIIPRFYYNSQAKECQSFDYGGCGGNANNFQDIASCNEACTSSNPCTLPKEPGPCRQTLPRYYYNPRDNECQKFIYGGCGGNANNFQELGSCNEACSSSKPGQCPQFRCPGRQCDGRDECGADSDCQGNTKCCQTCSGCRQCLCGANKCGLDEECRLVTIVCIRAPCLPPVLTCVSTVSPPLVCPTARPGSGGGGRCSRDGDCGGGEECCPGLTGVTSCVAPVRPVTCHDVACAFDETCREVLDGVKVNPRCLQNPPTSLQDDQCQIGLPLLLQLATSGGQITQANCFEERDAISCPKGYGCVGAGRGFSLCCRQEERPCNPPCGKGSRCETTPIACLVPPCPPTPRCEAEDICLLPAVVGPCKASIPSYYYDAKAKRCNNFTYGGCGGNENRFISKYKCERTCRRTQNTRG